MLIDTLNLAPGAKLSSLPIPFGTTFPANPDPWVLFRLTAVQGANQPGTYLYNQTTLGWEKLAPDAVAPVTPVYPLDILVQIPGKPAASEVILDVLVGRAFSLDSVNGKVGVNGTTAGTTFTFTKNGTSIGTVVFPANQAGNPTVTVAVTSFAVNDVLKVTAPASQNATLADVSMYLKGRAL